MPVPDDATWDQFVQQVVQTLSQAIKGLELVELLLHIPTPSCNDRACMSSQVQLKLKLSSIDSIYLVSVSIPRAASQQ